MKTKILENLKAIILGLIITLGAGYVMAAGVWTLPGCTPPNCNTDAPVNVGDSAQTKTGKLSIGPISTGEALNVDGITLTKGLFVNGGGFTFNDISKGVGRVLVSDVDGRGTWKSIGDLLGGDSISVISFRSDYFSLTNDADFNAWFSSQTNGAAILANQPSTSVIGGRAEVPRSFGWIGYKDNVQYGTDTRITADKICSYFTGGPSVSFETTSYPSENTNWFIRWNESSLSPKWEVIFSQELNASDIKTVSCLATNGVIRGNNFRQSLTSVPPGNTSVPVNRGKYYGYICENNKIGVDSAGKECQ